MSFDPRNLSQADQQQMVRYQQLGQSLDAIVQQRAQMESQLKQVDFALKELENAGEEAILYRSVGGIFIQSTQAKLIESSKEEKETLEMRIKSLQMQEERLRGQFDKLTSQIKEIMKKNN